MSVFYCTNRESLSFKICGAHERRNFETMITRTTKEIPLLMISEVIIPVYEVMSVLMVTSGKILMILLTLMTTFLLMKIIIRVKIN